VIYLFQDFYCWRYYRFIDPSKSTVTTINDIYNLIEITKYIKYPYFLSTYTFLYRSLSDAESNEFRKENNKIEITETMVINLEDENITSRIYYDYEFDYDYQYES
jgi:hypothetical protein